MHIVHPSSEILVYPTISEIVYQNIALYQIGRLEITKMVEERSTSVFNAFSAWAAIWQIV